MASNDDGYKLLEPHIITHSQQGNLSQVEELLKQGAELDIKDSNSRTALWRASKHGHSDVVEHLLSHGADTEVRTGDYKTTALHIACKYGHLNVVKCLIQAGADGNAKNIKGTSPLYYASESGNLSVVEELLKHGVDNVDAKTSKGRTALWMASYTGHSDVVGLLLSHGADTEVRDDDNDMPLHVACQEGHLDVVKCLIQAGAHVNAKDINGLSPLYYASQSGNLSVVEELLKHGVEVDATTSKGRNALWTASFNGHSDVVELLLSHGADTEVRGGDEATALHVACQRGNLNVVKCLIQNGANVNAKDINGASPLYYASTSGNLSVVEELLKQGVYNVDAQTSDGRTALWTASFNGHSDVVELLLSHGADTEVKGGHLESTALHAACQAGHLDVVKCLIQAGAHVNAKNINGTSPLHYASQSGNLSVVEELVKHGVDNVDAKTSDCRTALWMASYNGHSDVVELLLSHGADTEVKGGPLETTALHVACQEGNLNVVKCLIQNGAHVNAKDINGASPLYYASQSGNLSVVEELLKQGVDNVDAKDRDGTTALWEASFNDYSDVVKLLLSHGADTEVRGGPLETTALHAACEKGHLNVVKCLIQAGANVTAKDINGISPLHYASRSGNLSVVEELLKHGVDNVDTKTSQGRTALWTASYNGHSDVVELLLSHGADTELRDGNYEMPLHMACQEGHLDVVKCLIQARAHVNAKNINGISPLHYASHSGNLSVVEELIKQGVDNVETQDSEESAPLHVACQRGHLNVVKCLIQTGANVNDKNINGSILLAACVGGQFDIVKYLHKQGFDIHAAHPDSGKTSLMCAAQSGNLELVKWLVHQNVDVTKVANDGRSALHMAAHEGHIPVMEYLLNLRVDIDIIDEQGVTPLALATAGAHTQAVQWLVKQGARTDVTPLDRPLADHAASFSDADQSKKGEVSNYLNSPELVFIHGKDDTTVQWNDKEKTALFETCDVKVATVGELKSGKTSLARSLISSNQYRTHVDERTVVMEQRNWRVSDSSTITVVDLGGHKSYHNTAYFFIANHPSNVVLLCHEITSKRYHVTYFWLRGVITRAPRCHVIPVLTKKDLVSSDTAVETLVQEFLKEMGQFMNKDVEDMEIKQYMDSTSRENRLRIKVLIKRYKELKEEFPALICVTSTAPLQGKTIDPLKTHIRTWSQTEEYGVKLPLSNYQFYSVIGGLGSKVLEPNDTVIQLISPSKLAFRNVTIPQQEENTAIKVKGEDLEHVKQVECYNRNAYTQSNATEHEEILVLTKSKQYITFKEAKQTFQTIEKRLGKMETSDEDTKILLRRLHHRGLVLWFQGSPLLENIIFNNLEAFTSVLKTFFHHDVHQFLKFESMAPKQKALFENRKKKFENSLQQLTEEGVMALPVLKCLLLQSDCDLDHGFITSLLQKLNLGYKYEVKDETMLLVPYFIESRLIPLDLYLELAEFRKSTSCELSLVSSIEGNLSQTFFNFVLLKMFEYLQKKNPLQQRLVWGKGMKAPLGSGNMLLLYHGHQCINLVIKCPPKDLLIIWKCITYFCTVSKELRNVWWPGLATGVTLKCAACAVSNSSMSHSHHIKSIMKFTETNQCELDLEDLVESEVDQDEYICSGKQRVPIGIVQPVRAGDPELPQRISDIENPFLQQTVTFEELVQSRTANRATEIVHEMMTASYFCLADDLHCTFAEHLNKIGAMSKALPEEVDCLYRTEGPKAAVCKLTQTLKREIHLIDAEQLLVSIKRREKLDVVKWFTALYTKITGELEPTDVLSVNLSQYDIRDDCFTTVVKPLLKILSKALQEVLDSYSELPVNSCCFSIEVRTLVGKVSRELDNALLTILQLPWDEIKFYLAKYKGIVENESKTKRGLLANVSQVSINDEYFSNKMKPLLEIFSKTLYGLLHLYSILIFNEPQFFSIVCKTLPMLLEKASQVQCGIKFRNINMSSNNLSQLPNLTSDSMFEDTSGIDLSFNKILDMNSNYIPLNLLVLNLSFNRLEFIPSLAHLSMLRELDISHNRIRKVSGLPAHLEKLRLWSNPLEELSQDCFPNQEVYGVVKRAVFPYMLSVLQKPPANVFKQGYTQVKTFFDPSYGETAKPHRPFTHSSIDALLHNPGWIESFSNMINFKVTLADLQNIISAMCYSCFLTYPSNPTPYTGTGFFLGFLQQHSSGKTLSCIATSHHHLPLWTPGSTGHFVFDKYDDVSGNYTAIPVSLDHVIWSDKRLDYAIFAVENDQLWQRFGQNDRPLNSIFIPQSPSDLPEDNSVLFLLGHPGGSPMHVDSLQIVSKQTIMNDPKVDKAQSLAKFGVNSSTNLNALEDEVYLYYYCTSFGGTSGAPCYRFAGGQVKLYAIHSGGMHTSTDKAQPGAVSDYEFGVYMCAVIRDIEKQRSVDFSWI